ncbi:MAG: hypothetical protein ACRDL5_18920 [Solirubrobacteraceae bacterium]
MSFTDYILDSVLVLLVLLQIKERPLTDRSLLRPLVIVGIAVVVYMNGLPTAGNNLVLIGLLAAFGAAIGIASGVTVRLRPGRNGQVLARAGWAAAFLWVLGMGSRFAFAFWATHGGSSAIGQFSVQHAISGGQAWTAALLMMALLEVCGRTLALVIRRSQVGTAPAIEAA